MPPRRALAFLRWFCREDFIEEIEGDLTEIFEKEYLRAPRLAQWKFTWRVIKYFRPGFLKSFRHQYQPDEFSMYKNYFKIAMRSLWNNRIFSFINISGLAVGLACCILIFLFIQHELSYDQFHSRSSQIYRVTSVLQNDEHASELAVTPAPWAPLLKKDFPEIENYTRLLKDEKAVAGEPGQQHFYEAELLYADSTFFDMFSVAIIKGDHFRPLDRPNAIVITEEMAGKYFSDTDPIGKTLEVSSYGRNFNLEVTAIVKKLPSNSHFSFSCLVSMQTLGDLSSMWSFHMFHSYLLLNDNTAASTLEKKLPGFVEKYIANNTLADGRNDIHLQPITDIHLHSHLVGEMYTNSDIYYIYMFEGVALFILLIACFNFTNLTTAKSFSRAQEVGLRKAVGAEKRQLFFQFLSETFLFSLISLVVAIGIAILALPLFNQLSSRELTIDLTGNTQLLKAMLFLIAGVGIVAGMYPAAVLSSLKPIEVLKGKFVKSGRGVGFRKLLVTIQFAVSISLIASTLIVSSQLRFLQEKNLGFDRQNIAILTLPRDTDSVRLESFKTSLLGDHEIISVAASSAVPSEKIAVNQVNGGSADLTDATSVQMLFVDTDFIPTLKMNVIAGRNLDHSATDASQGFIVNEEAVKKLGWQDPANAIGKTIQWVMQGTVLKRGTVVGVVKDFNVSPLRSAIKPLVMHYRTGALQYLYVRFHQTNSTSVLESIHKKFRASYPNQSFEYTFLDDTLNNLYRNEQRLGAIFSTFSLLAILIACLGVFGLSFYSIQQRTKEIGIRKVLGAPVAGITVQLMQEFLKPVIIAASVSTPIVWYAMHEWLREFAYHIQVSWTVFPLVTMIVITLTVLTMATQSIKAAMQDPVKSLRTE